MRNRLVFVYALGSGDAARFAVADLNYENCTVRHGGGGPWVAYAAFGVVDSYKVEGVIQTCPERPTAEEAADGYMGAGDVAKALLDRLVAEGTAAGDPRLPTEAKKPIPFTKNR